MDSEFCKPRSYKSVSSSETIPNIAMIETSEDSEKIEDIYVQLVEIFKSLFTETYSALF